MIPASDLELLQSFQSNGQATLTAYLRLDTPQLRDSAYDAFAQEVQSYLDEGAVRPEWKDAIREDMEIVGVYLETNGHRNHAGMAIFSCATELFWRAYSLSQPVPTQVSIGPRFDVAPLLQTLEQPSAP